MTIQLSSDPKQRAVDMRDALARLSADILLDTARMSDLAERWAKGFHQYSFINLLLIWHQMPTSTLCAGYSAWLHRHKRNVKKGEHALWVFAPCIKREEETTEQGTTRRVDKLIGFRAVPTFDISQTEGPALNIGANRAVFSGGDVTAENISKLFDIPTRFVETMSDGSTDGKEIRVALRQNKAQMVCSYFHELAHILLGHTDKELCATKNSQIRELEAEAVAYITARCVGVENEDAAAYIRAWGGGPTELESSGEAVLRVANRIANRLFEKQDETEES